MIEICQIHACQCLPFMRKKFRLKPLGLLLFLSIFTLLHSNQAVTLERSALIFSTGFPLEVFPSSARVIDPLPWQG